MPRSKARTRRAPRGITSTRPAPTWGGVTLTDAMVTMANSDGAPLAGADLQGETLSHVRLDTADLSGACLRGAVAVDVSLRRRRSTASKTSHAAAEFVVALPRPVAGEEPRGLLLLGALARPERPRVGRPPTRSNPDPRSFSRAVHGVFRAPGGRV